MIAFGLAACLACGCGGPSRRVADWTPPEAAGTGTLEVTVVGLPGPVEYFLDGVRIVPDRDWNWAGDARLELALAPGTYRFEGRFRIGRFELRPLRSTLRTRHAVRVAAGRTTRLRADVRRLPSADPVEAVHYFQVLEPPADEPLALAGPSTRDVPIATPWPSPDRAQALLEPLARHEGDLVPAPAGGRTAPTEIAIHGSEVYLEGRRWDGVRSGKPAPPSDDAAPARGPRAEVLVLVESDPPGAHVSVAGRYLGRTPLRAAVDPTRDHVLHFQREGCSEQVQLVDADSWKRGRTPAVSVRLDCR